MTASFMHHHLPSDASDADWQQALPDGWQTPLASEQRLIGTANPWISTRIALISPTLRHALQCDRDCLMQANGPLPATDMTRAIVLSQAQSGTVEDWLAQTDALELSDGHLPTVISSPDDDETIKQRLQRLYGPSGEDWRHGVFMEVSGLGVLIRGAAGIGKSELALELLSRGHRLIADDAPCFTAYGDEVAGRCPERLFGLLEVRGIGILDIRELFGSHALKIRKYLRLIVDLYPADAGQPIGADERLFGDRGNEQIAGQSIPVWRLPVAPGRNLAVLLEAIVRQRNLERQSGGQFTSPRIAALFADDVSPPNPQQTAEPQP